MTSKRDIIEAKNMSPDQLECYRMAVDIVGGEQHLRGSPKRCGHGIQVTIGGEFATTDSNLLTRVVVLAHDRAIRATLTGGGPYALTLKLWKRTRDGDFFESHPTLEDHAARIRERTRLCRIYGVDQ